jgi:hypothetical protein
VLYLQKEGVLRGTFIEELFAVDDNQREGLDLAVRHAKALGIPNRVVPVQANFYLDDCWKLQVPSGDAGLVTAISPNDGISLFVPHLLFSQTADASGRLFFAQAVSRSGLHGSVSSQLKERYDVRREGEVEIPDLGEKIYTAFCARKEK